MVNNPITLQAIQAARQRVSDVIYHSPCPYSLNLSRICDCRIYCKVDHLQMTGSFKERGARNKLKLLGEEQRRHGVIAASAGNHALALAYHGRELGVPVTVVMPRWAPIVKVSNCRSFGANIIQIGESYDEAKKHALQLASERQLMFVHGFDDPDIIAGQGTVGLEILEDVPDVDVVIVPVGGGGLIAGVASAIKAIRPEVRVIGVEPKAAPTLHESLRQGAVVHIKTEPTLADGLAIAEVGQRCFEIARRLVDQVILVDEVQIATSILRLLELEKMVLEGAGAVPLAAAVDPALCLSGKKVVLVLSGGNIDVTLIARIIERGLAAEGRLCRIVAQISDRPGSLAGLLATIASAGGSIKEVSHDRNFGPADVARVAVSCIMETRDFDHIREIHAALEKAGVSFTHN
ncbi:MAG: threonine ammonia-lyase [Bacillota bacterium]